QPEDIAPPVAFLASDEARWITGETIFVSGERRFEAAGLHRGRLGRFVGINRPEASGHTGRALESGLRRFDLQAALISLAPGVPLILTALCAVIRLRALLAPPCRPEAEAAAPPPAKTDADEISLAGQR